MTKKTAFVFAGQGAQYPGMGRSLYENFAPAREILDMTERILPGNIKMCFEGTPGELSVTKNTQPALFAVELACAEVLRGLGVNADMAAGFSLGEIPALAYAGVIDAERAFRFVVERAAAMQVCAEENPGGMAAVLKLDGSAVAGLCEETGGVYPVNFNCPGQTVVAGSESSLARFIEAATSAGGKCVKLAVGGAFHSPYMAGASERLASYLAGETLCAPEIPLYSNVTALPYPADAAPLIAEQVKSPVLWETTIRGMAGSGAEVFVEIGPGKVLSGLIKRIIPGAAILNADSAETVFAVLKEVNNA